MGLSTRLDGAPGGIDPGQRPFDGLVGSGYLAPGVVPLGDGGGERLAPNVAGECAPPFGFGGPL